MKALVADAEWSPKKGYPLGKDEERQKRVVVGSQVWKNPSFETKEVPTPDVGDYELLIRVKSCGICGSDTHLYETDGDGYIIFSGLTRLPCILGHEFSGIVEKTGGMVANFREGDIVAVESVMWCGRCTACRSGTPNQCENVELMGLSIDGALAEHIAVNERYCWKINGLKDRYGEDEIFDIGSLIEPVGCAYNGIFIAGGGFNPGATIVVYGAGPIGLGAVALAKIAGASRVIAFDVIDERVKLAIEMGADEAFNINGMDGVSPSDKVLELTDGRGANVQVEAAGAAPKTIPEMEKSLANKGKIIYLGRAATKTPMFLDALVTGAAGIIGSRGHSGHGIFPSIIMLLERGKLNLAPMITKKYTFSTALEALKDSVNRTDGKIVVGF